MNAALDLLVRPLNRDNTNFLEEVRLSQKLWSQVVAASRQGGGPEPDASISQLSRRESAAFARGIRAGFAAASIPYAGPKQYDPNQFRTASGSPAVHSLAAVDSAKVDELIALLESGGGVSIRKCLPQM